MDTRRKEFMEVVEQLKSIGYKVYTGAKALDNDYYYGYVLNEATGKFCYMQIDFLDGLHLSAECVPSKDTGSGFCPSEKDLGIFKYTSEGRINKDYVEAVMNYKYGTPWKSFDAFLQYESKFKTSFVEL